MWCSQFIRCCFIVQAFFGSGQAAEIKGIDLYGSDDLKVEQLIDAEPELCAKFCAELVAENGAKVEAIQAELSEKLKQKFLLAYVRPTAITYFASQQKSIYITFDLVETKDAAHRLNFKEIPEATFKDPQGLIAAWDLYMQTAWELLQAGEIDAQMVRCDAFHYIFGHQHPKLAPFEKLFMDGVNQHRDALIEIFLKDHRDHFRSVAAFLLAYVRDGQMLVDVLAQGLRDGSSEVRNNVMRVFACVATDHPEISLPVDEVIQALDFPNTTDRNKAAAIIYGLLSHNSDCSITQKLRAAVPTLLKMMRLKQPNNSDWAYQILKKLSQLDYAKDDFAAWEDWYLTPDCDLDVYEMII